MIQDEAKAGGLDFSVATDEEIESFIGGGVSHLRANRVWAKRHGFDETPPRRHALERMRDAAAELLRRVA